MSSTAVAYGARELQRNLHRYWGFGFAFSVLIHLSLLGSYYLAGISQQGGFAPHPQMPPGGLLPTTRPNFLPGIVPLGPIHPAHLPQSIGKGTPVPVKNASPDAVLASQTELAAAKEPVGAVSEVDGRTGEVIIPPEEESEPPPFRPVQIEPHIVLTVTPEYPRLAVETGLEGKVWVKIWVAESGKPRKAVIVKGDADILNEAALAAAMKFLFTPAIMNGRPVSVWVAIPFSFKLH